MPLIKSFLNPMVEMIVDQWWKNQFGARAHESQYVPFIDIAIEMVEKDLGVAFLFGNDWKINEEKVQLIPAYDLQGEPVKREVWMMLSDKCYQSQTIVDFIDFVEKFYQEEK